MPRRERREIAKTTGAGYVALLLGVLLTARGDTITVSKVMMPAKK